MRHAEFCEVPCDLEIRHGSWLGRARIGDPAVSATLRRFWGSPPVTKADLAAFFCVSRRTVQTWGRELGLTATRPAKSTMAERV